MQNSIDNSKTLQKDEDANLSKEIVRLIAVYEKINNIRNKELAESNFRVSQVLGSLAFLYERIRNTLDYKGDHLLRRNAIERILRRQIWEKKSKDLEKLPENLIKELIWARYLKNDSVPKGKIQKLSIILQNYLKFFSFLTEKLSGRDLENNTDWFMGVLSSEIDEILDLNAVLRESVNYEVYSWFRNRFVWIDHDLNTKEQDTQIFIAIHRSMSKSDKPGIRRRLLSAYMPEWSEFQKLKTEDTYKKLLEMKDLIETQLNSHYQPRMFRFIQRQIPAFFVLRDYLDESYKHAKKTMADPEKFDKSLREICQKKYHQIGSRIRRGIVRSVIYIFLTKALLAMMMEIPYELFVAKSVNYLTLSINVMFPPVLMFMIGSTIKKPGRENTSRILHIIKSFVYKDDDIEKIPFSLERRKIGNIISKIFLAFYIFLFFLMFSAIGLVLIELGFNVLSATIFFVFLSLVLLFVYRVRYTATELNVQGEREGFVSHLFSLVTTPFINFGLILSQGLQRLNFFLMMMDFLIEAPLKNVLSIFEDWTVFLKEKREEVIEVPN